MGFSDPNRLHECGLSTFCIPRKPRWIWKLQDCQYPVTNLRNDGLAGGVWNSPDLHHR